MRSAGKEKSGMPKHTIVELLTADQALAVVRSLLAKGGAVAEAIASEAVALLGSIDAGGVTGEVLSMLMTIDMQDCLDKAGTSRSGYVSPRDAAAELMEEVLDPFVEQVGSYHRSGMHRQEWQYLEAVLCGLYEFEHSGSSDFLEWCDGMAWEFAEGMVREWRKRHRGDVLVAEEFVTRLERNCSSWDWRSILL